LIVGTGEVPDGAFPSLAVGATELLFEDVWNARHDVPDDATRRLDHVLAQSPALARELGRALAHVAGGSGRSNRSERAMRAARAADVTAYAPHHDRAPRTKRRAAGKRSGSADPVAGADDAVGAPFSEPTAAEVFARDR